MGSFGPIHWIVVGIVILVLFGRGRISEMMGDLGKGVSSFKKGLSDEESKRDPLLGAPPREIDATRRDDLREARRPDPAPADVEVKSDRDPL